MEPRFAFAEPVDRAERVEPAEPGEPGEPAERAALVGECSVRLEWKSQQHGVAENGCAGLLEGLLLTT
jgi:hypothetical protein